MEVQKQASHVALCSSVFSYLGAINMASNAQAMLQRCTFVDLTTVPELSCGLCSQMLARWQTGRGGAVYAGSSANVSILASNFTSLRATTTVQHTCEHSVLLSCVQSQAGGRGGAIYGDTSAQIDIADSSFNACSAEVYGGVVYGLSLIHI